MNPKILNTEVQQFIDDNLSSEIQQLLLKGLNFENINSRDIIEQIEAKSRCKKKLPTWFKTKNIYYPNKLNIEQTSSETTAQYKSQLFSGLSIADLTGGFGVDSYYFSKQFETVHHFEIDKNLSQIAKHNFNQLGIKNVYCFSDNGIDFLSNSQTSYDWIYIDPSRRHKSKGKVFFLNDCIPDVPNHLTELFEKTDHIAIKTSPLLDISVGIKELKHIKDIHIIAVKNEVKELIWILENGFDGEISIKTVNITADANETFCFNYLSEFQAISSYEQPLQYLYEPNSAILKAGGFNNVAIQLNLAKLHKHSHLYTSNHLIDFPGRCFKINMVIEYNKKNLRTLNISKANITTRNFPERAQELRKKLKIKNGGNTYLFFTTDFSNKKTILKCSKVA